MSRHERRFSGGPRDSQSARDGESWSGTDGERARAPSTSTSLRRPSSRAHTCNPTLPKSSVHLQPESYGVTGLMGEGTYVFGGCPEDSVVRLRTPSTTTRT